MYDVARCSPRGVSRKIVEIYRRPETTVAHKGHLDIFDRELFISDRLNIRRLDSTDEFSYPAGKVTQFSRSAVDDSIPAFRPRCPQKHSIHFRGSLGDSCACSHFTTTGSRARDTQCAAQPTSVRVQKWDISKCLKKKKTLNIPYGKKRRSSSESSTRPRGRTVSSLMMNVFEEYGNGLGYSFKDTAFSRNEDGESIKSPPQTRH